jgi:hypothetical protein
VPRSSRFQVRKTADTKQLLSNFRTGAPQFSQLRLQLRRASGKFSMPRPYIGRRATIKTALYRECAPWTRA